MKNCYLINYDIKNLERKAIFEKALQSYWAETQILGACWAIVTEDSASLVLDHLRKQAGPEARLLIVKYAVECPWEIIACDQK